MGVDLVAFRFALCYCVVLRLVCLVLGLLDSCSLRLRLVLLFRVVLWFRCGVLVVFICVLVFVAGLFWV